MRSKNAIKNIIFSLLQQAVTIICGFITPVLIIRTFGSEANGLLVSITQFLGYITLLESGFGPVVKSILYKYIAKRDKHTVQAILKSTESFFRKIAAIFIIYVIGLCFVYPKLINSQFHPLFTTSLLVIMAFSTLAEYFFGITYSLYLQAKQKAYITAILQTVTTAMVTISVVLLIGLGCNLQTVKLVSSLFFVVKPLILTYYVKRKYSINLKNTKKGYRIQQKWDGLAQHIAAVIHGNTDVVVLSIFSKLTEISVYAVYALITTGIKRIIQSFNAGIDASFGDLIAKKEQERLNRRFSTYELFYHTISTIIFSCAIVLITPFISVYTKEVNDVDYIRPLFGILITISEFIWAIRLPYSSIVLAAGHFKQTKKGAWIEALTNIIISSVLVFNLGIVGVAIGTIIAMFIRTIEFIYHNSRYILKRSIMQSFSWLPIIALETILVTLIAGLIIPKEYTAYSTWIISAIITLAISMIIILPINILSHRKDTKDLMRIGKRIRRKE